MTKMITVICPKCHGENSVASPPPSSGSRVECRQCQHQFTVVSKSVSNKQAAMANQSKVEENHAAKANSATNAAEVMEMLSHALNMNQNISGKRQVKKSLEHSNDTVQSSNKNSADKCPNLNTLLNPSSRRIEIPMPNEPQAEALRQANLQATLANNELLQNINSPSPLVNTPQNNNTPIPLPECGTTNIEMNGNIGNLNNLVFTLLPGESQRQADVPLLLNDAIEKTDAIHAKTEFLHHQQDKLSKEFNWTLATIVALTVLIMQLFYLMAVR
jgi:hypothetical protein